MAYVTSTQIVARLGNDTAVRLTTDTGSTVDTDLIDAIITEVEAAINQALRTRTAATITQTDYPQTLAMLRGKAVAMVIFNLASRRPPVPEAWANQNKQAREWLDKLAKGEVNLPDTGLNDPGFEWGSADQNAAAEDR